jgi:hypothetical protein
LIYLLKLGDFPARELLEKTRVPSPAFQGLALKNADPDILIGQQ